jgi:predicted nucleic acid-binding protein
MFLLDTNVVSEMRRPRPDLAVRTWVENRPRDLQFLSVISLTEISHGASRHADPLQRRIIQQWLDGPLRIWFEGRILDITPDVAEAAGVLIGERHRRGAPLALADALLAATSMKKGFVLVTRNTKDFVKLPFAVYDPWTNHLTMGEQRR